MCSAEKSNELYGLFFPIIDPSRGLFPLFFPLRTAFDDGSHDPSPAKTNNGRDFGFILIVYGAAKFWRWKMFSSAPVVVCLRRGRIMTRGAARLRRNVYLQVRSVKTLRLAAFSFGVSDGRKGLAASSAHPRRSNSVKLLLAGTSTASVC